MWYTEFTEITEVNDVAKNVTVQVGDELAAKMEKLPDVNWSQVVRICIQKYCNIRLNPNIEALKQKMKQQKDEAYSEGYKAALEWFKQEDVRYEDVNEIFQRLNNVRADFQERIKEMHGTFENAANEGTDPTILLNAEETKFWNKTIEAISERFFNDSFDMSTVFIQGFKAALQELEEVE